MAKFYEFQPGRVVSLVPEPNGICWGVAYKIKEEAVASTLQYLDHREKAGYQVAIRNQMIERFWIFQLRRVYFYPYDGSASFELGVYISEANDQNIYHSGPTDIDEIVKQVLTKQ